MITIKIKICELKQFDDIFNGFISDSIKEM